MIKLFKYIIDLIKEENMCIEGKFNLYFSLMSFIALICFFSTSKIELLVYAILDLEIKNPSPWLFLIGFVFVLIFAGFCLYNFNIIKRKNDKSVNVK